MLIHQLISSDIPALHLEDTGDKALQLMQELHLEHLSLIDGDEYKALIKEDDILNWDTPEQPLSSAEFLLNFRPVVYGHLHPYEAIRRAVQQNISVVPVISSENKYLGSVSRVDLFEFLAHNSGLEQQGGIVALDIKPADYSLSEISRICENNDVLILNVQVNSLPEKESMEVIIKTNTKEVQALIASFERYEYNVKEVFGEMPAHENMLDRYQSLMHYINM
jgi:acetoin utilization protein AcuB